MEGNGISYITLIVYPVLVAILMIGSKICKKGEYNENWNSISETKAIQGLTALCIVCHHTAQQTCVDWLPSGNIVHGLDLFSNTGFLFVSVFFFWSGYGLYKSVSSKPRYLNHFFKKRVLPILAPYALVCFLFTFERLFVFKEKMPLWFKITNFTGITIGYYFGWYIQAILLFYILFYFSFKKARYDLDAMIYVWIGVVLWIVAGLIVDHNDYFLRGQWWYNSTLLFPIGMTFAKHDEKIIGGIKKKYGLILSISVPLLFVFFFLSRYMEFTKGFYGEMMGFSFERKILYRFITYLPQLLTAVTFVLILILLSMKIEFKNKVLDFLGSHTLEIYLTHGFFLEFLAMYYNYHKDSIFYGNPLLLLIVTIVPTVFAAALLKKLGRLL